MNSTSRVEPLTDTSPGHPSVRGFIHHPITASGRGLVLTHGAGGSCNSPLLVAMAEAFCENGITVLRCDLPFRQKRPYGPPLGTADDDQAGLKRAAELLRKLGSSDIFVGGHSYGGRMATMLAAEQPSVASGLLLLSYPLHPPRKPQQLRTAHFPKLQTRALFAQGTRDPFGSIEEMESALQLIPAQTRLVWIEGAGHELAAKSNHKEIADRIAVAFTLFVGLPE